MGRTTGEELIGKKIGRLTVLSVSKPYIWHGKIFDYFMRCRCDCGKEVDVRRCRLTVHNPTNSCGCIQTEILIARNSRHSLSNTVLYSRYLKIKNRCYNPNCKSYKNYGGRGIRMCDEWFKSFETFYKWAINNGFRKELTIDRIDNDGDYSPGNCRWVTTKVQNYNKRSNRFYTYNGKTLSIIQWGHELGGGQNLVKDRIDKLGWDIERALSTPPINNFKHRKAIAI